MSAANSKPTKVRGELKLKLCDKEFTMKPDFKSLDNMEEYLETDIFTFLMTVGIQQKVTLRQIAYCVHQAIAAYTGDEDDPSFDEVAELIVAEGPLIVLPKLVNFLMDSMVTEEQAKKIQKEQKKTGGKRQRRR